ncbi:MAG: hypothetical protein VCE43_20710 [Myxococcota bacterium]
MKFEPERAAGWIEARDIDSLAPGSRADSRNAKQVASMLESAERLLPRRRTRCASPAAR